MDHIDEQTSTWLIGIFCTASAGLWAALVWMVQTGRKDARASQRRCEDQNAHLVDEIRSVRNDYSGQLSAKLLEASISMNNASHAQRESNAVQAETNRILNRVCLRLESLSGKSDRRPTSHKTPPSGNLADSE